MPVRAYFRRRQRPATFRQALEGVSPTTLNALTGFVNPFRVTSPTAAVSISLSRVLMSRREIRISPGLASARRRLPSLVRVEGEALHLSVCWVLGQQW